MATLHVRNLDDDLVHELKVRAAHNGRSAEAEHREILRQALRKAPVPEHWTQKRDATGLTWAERAAALRAQTAGRQLVPSEVLLRESRDER